MKNLCFYWCGCCHHHPRCTRTARSILMSWALSLRIRRPRHRRHRHLRHHRRVLYHDRRGELAAIKYTVDLVNHRVPVIAGAGSNDTDHGCALVAKSACGADALLLVTPYYNKTSQAGLVAHFTAMAEAGGIPVILYNVPSRTGLNIAPETAKELSKHPLINGIKEASGNIGQVAKIAALCGDELNIYSGNDDQVVPCCLWAARASSASFQCQA